MSTAIMMTITVVSVTASGYDNIYENVCQINSFITDGMYLEAIAECDQTKAWHNLSQTDIGILDSLRTQAQEKYDNYIYSLTAVYDDITANVNQINSFISRGLYFEAMQECDQTKAWHNLSLADIVTLDGLKTQAHNCIYYPGTEIPRFEHLVPNAKLNYQNVEEKIAGCLYHDYSYKACSFDDYRKYKTAIEKMGWKWYDGHTEYDTKIIDNTIKKVHRFAVSSYKKKGSPDIDVFWHYNQKIASVTWVLRNR
uniref:Uncharacterized protein n=1 Tax=uncultured Bacillota bacterium TaxID=344338 RepID=A0A650ENS8_9FIRM|nr:hypothetical protein Firmicute1046_1680 [uncultured Firmicutes bacterium]